MHSRGKSKADGCWLCLWAQVVDTAMYNFKVEVDSTK
jgi:hypothetical protein